MLPAMEASSAEVVVVADADCWTDGIDVAVAAVAEGAKWALPHRGVFRLTADATDVLLKTEAVDWERLPLDRPAYLGTEGGGFVVAPRETLLDIPMDERFVGWGNEDESWGVALRCLLGPAWRKSRVPLVHLWHPPQERLTMRWGSLESKALRKRYEKVRDDPVQMRRLLEEIDDRDRPEPDQPLVRDHEPHGVGHRG